MAIRVNPKFIDVLDRFGAEDVQLCYQCGDCSTICPHADDVYKFPRKSMRLLQMGLSQKIETTLEPWLCYYCGQCSEQCPREADPGETMMSLRRWLISRYDFTGIARQFFKSRLIEVLAVLIIALLTGIFLLYYGFSGGSIHIYDGEGAFLSSTFIHKFNLTVGAILAVFLVINAIRMWYLVMIKGTQFAVPWWLYLKELYQLPWHFFTQKRYSECEKKREHPFFMPWFIHLGLMLGYVTMLVLVIVFIEQLQSGPEIKWSVHIFGYLATIGLITGTIYFIRNRLKKNYVQYKKSHSTDWVFVILLFIIVLTGIAQHVFHRTGLFEWANITYVIHLMCVVPWLLRVPFSKWAHLIYRPLAMYLAAIRRAALALQEVVLDSYPVFIK
ncbi:MAG: 4Fe-4S dicluster domain-containing protein [Bacteroidales bacterium]|nr:4Fe-4S dicluster domain-containing protein [Bacteroidales bacterium]